MLHKFDLFLTFPLGLRVYEEILGETVGEENTGI